MKNNIEIENIYLSTKKLFNSLKNENSFTFENLGLILTSLLFDNQNIDFRKNNFDIKDISKLLKFYADEMNKNFVDDKNRFTTLFKSYILVIESLTQLCLMLSKQKSRRKDINTIFQMLKESKNMTKLFIPLEQENVNIINNYLGKQLYHYSHIQYTSMKDKDIDYILQDFHMKIESMIHGYELSVDTNFANCNITKEEAENYILLNNISFILLKLIHKLNIYHVETNYFENPYFMRIINLFKTVAVDEKETDITSLEQFEKILNTKFLKSAKGIFNYYSIDVFDEKLELLEHNTDDYKQLIDIILLLKNHSVN